MIIEYLKNSNFFGNIEEIYLKDIANISTIKEYHKKQILFYEYDEPKYLHLLLTGSVKIYKFNAKNQEIVIHHIVAENFIAEIANFENILYPANCEMLEDSTVLKIDYKKFETYIKEHANISFKLMKSLSSKIKVLSNFINNELILSTQEKVLNFIIEYENLLPTIKHHQIAKILNITPETLSRTLAKMKNEGMLESTSPIKRL
jgi:CRP/FNR family transcriptional regulator